MKQTPNLRTPFLVDTPNPNFTWFVIIHLCMITNQVKLGIGDVGAGGVGVVSAGGSDLWMIGFSEGVSMGGSDGGVGGCLDGDEMLASGSDLWCVERA